MSPIRSISLILLLAVELAAQGLLVRGSAGEAPPAGIITTGLTGWFKVLDGTGDTTAETSGVGNAAQLGQTAGADTTDPTWATDGGEVILTFDGADDDVELTAGDTDLFQSVASYTLYFVVKTSDTNEAQRIFGDSGGDLTVEFSSTDRLQARVTQATGVARLSSFTSVAWNCITIVFDGGGAADADKLKIYVNSVLQSVTFPVTGVPTATSAALTELRIGTLTNSLHGSWAYGLLYPGRIHAQANVDQDYAAIKADKPGLGLP